MRNVSLLVLYSLIVNCSSYKISVKPTLITYNATRILKASIGYIYITIKNDTAYYEAIEQKSVPINFNQNDTLLSNSNRNKFESTSKMFDVDLLKLYDKSKMIIQFADIKPKQLYNWNANKNVFKIVQLYRSFPYGTMQDAYNVPGLYKDLDKLNMLCGTLNQVQFDSAMKQIKSKYSLIK